MAIVYRPIDPEDLAEVHIFTLFCENSGRDSTQGHIPDSGDERKKKVEEIIAQLTMDASKHHCVAAFDDGGMVGVIRLNMMTIDQRPACHVRALWVHPDHRGRGVATRLKELAETWARVMGAAFMDTNVRVTNERMIALNTKMGYDVARLNFRKRLD
jgi:ribosomal protein S18 acetylase RimI-like enzyme